MAATLDLYINEKPTEPGGQFAVSNKNGTPFQLPRFFRDDQIAIRVFRMVPNATGGLASQFTLQTQTGTCLVVIGRPNEPLTTWDSTSYDAVNKCFLGKLNLQTTEMRTALGSAGTSSAAIQLTFQVTFSDGNNRTFSQTVKVENLVQSATSGDAASVTDTVFTDRMESVLTDSDSVAWRRDGLEIYADVRRKSGGGIYEDADGLRALAEVSVTAALFASLSVAMHTSGVLDLVAVPSVSTATAVVGGVTGQPYKLTIAVVLTTELKAYPGCTQPAGADAHFCVGGNEAADNYNVLSLTDGTTIWHLNRNDSSTDIRTASYTAEIDVLGGATLTLQLDSRDGMMYPVSQSASVSCVSFVGSLGLAAFASDIERRVETLEIDDASSQSRLTALESFTQYMLSASTTDATPAELKIGGTTRISLPDLSSWAFELQVIGRQRVGNGGSAWVSRASVRQWTAVAVTPDGKHQVAVDGAPGYLWASDDYGVTWTQRTAAGSRTWGCVAISADGTKIFTGVGFPGGYIYISTDSGATFTQRASSRPWKSIATSSNGSKLVAASNTGTLWTSADGGITWTSRESSRDWRGVASSVDGTKLVAVANFGRIYTSSDSGVNWTARDSADRYWTAVASSVDGTKLLAVGDDVRVSTDSGATWSLTSAPAASWYGAASSADATRLAIAGDGDQFWISTDGGTTWALSYLAGASDAIACSADGLIIIGTGAGGFLYVTDTVGSEMVNFIRGRARRNEGAASVMVDARGDEFGAVDAIVAQADTAHGALRIMVTAPGATEWRGTLRLTQVTF